MLINERIRPLSEIVAEKIMFIPKKLAYIRTDIRNYRVASLIKETRLKKRLSEVSTTLYLIFH